MHAIIEATDPRQETAKVVQIGISLCTSFGMIQGEVVGYGVIKDARTKHVYYLIEHASETLKVGDLVKIRISANKK